MLWIYILGLVFATKIIVKGGQHQGLHDTSFMGMEFFFKFYHTPQLVLILKFNFNDALFNEIAFLCYFAWARLQTILEATRKPGLVWYI